MSGTSSSAAAPPPHLTWSATSCAWMLRRSWSGHGSCADGGMVRLGLLGVRYAHNMFEEMPVVVL